MKQLQPSRGASYDAMKILQKLPWLLDGGCQPRNRAWGGQHPVMGAPHKHCWHCSHLGSWDSVPAPGICAPQSLWLYAESLHQGGAVGCRVRGKILLLLHPPFCCRGLRPPCSPAQCLCQCSLASTLINSSWRNMEKPGLEPPTPAFPNKGLIEEGRLPAMKVPNA